MIITDTTPATRPRRGAAPFTPHDTTTGEHLTKWGKIIRHEYTLTRSKSGVQLSGPGLPSPITCETIDAARTMSDRLATQRADRATKARIEWEASCRRHAALKDGFMQAGR